MLPALIAPLLRPLGRPASGTVVGDIQKPSAHWQTGCSEGLQAAAAKLMTMRRPHSHQFVVHWSGHVWSSSIRREALGCVVSHFRCFYIAEDAKPTVALLTRCDSDDLHTMLGA